MRILKLFLLLSVFLLVINTAAALESYNIQYNIVGSKAVVQAIITADQLGTVSIPVPEDAETIELYINDAKTNAVIEDNSLTLNLNPNDQIKLGYITKEYIDKSNFLLSLPVKYNVQSLKIILVLPEEAVLIKPITETSGSIYPKPDSATTDGRSLIFIWEKDNLTAGDEISIFTMYKPKTSYTYMIIVFVIFVLVLYYILRKRPKKEFRPVIRVHEPDKQSVLEHLKEEEQQIVNILKQREGQCEQGTLRVVTGFSKAHLSRLLMELEARKVIYKEKRGKKNLIFLK